jgi:hypothetical protein
MSDFGAGWDCVEEYEKMKKMKYLRPPPTMAKWSSWFLNSAEVDGSAAVSKPMFYHQPNPKVITGQE